MGQEIKFAFLNNLHLSKLVVSGFRNENMPFLLSLSQLFQRVFFSRQFLVRESRFLKYYCNWVADVVAKRRFENGIERNSYQIHRLPITITTATF